MSFSDAWLELRPIKGHTTISRGATFQRRRRLLDADPLGLIVIGGVNYAPHSVAGYSVSAILYDLDGRPRLPLTAGPLAGQEVDGWLVARATAEQTAGLDLPTDVGLRATDSRIGIIRWLVTDDVGNVVELFRDDVTLEAE